jgi:hypothetical protein
MPLEIIYRTDGPWGPGKGSNLTAGEVDENNYNHDLRIGVLETSRPQPDNFANVAIAGTRITFTLVSGATLGPLDLPVLKWRGRGVWAPFTGYAANDTFMVVGNGLFLVLQDHLSAATFDRADGTAVTAGAFGVGTQYTILTVGTTDFTLIGAASNTIGVVFTATGAGAGTGTATLPYYSSLLDLGVGLYAAGVATFLGAPSSANLRAAVTDPTGIAGGLVFADSPTFINTPMAPTAAPGNNTTQIATTAYADAAATAFPAVQYSTSSVATGSMAAGLITGANLCVWKQTGATPGAQLVRTAAQLLADTPNGRIGQSTVFRIVETGAGTLTVTTDAGATVTLVGTMTVPTNTWRDFMLTLNSPTTATVQSLGAGDI